MAKNIGLNVNIPEKECDDVNCPFHGNLPVRGQVITGKVVSDRMQGSVVVARDYLHYVKKYKRYEKRSSKLHAHNPPCLGAKVGDTVKIAECRPLSKTKTFVVVEVTEE
ncbi:ribosomal protein S17P [Methanolacinia petrolearia DSM 11571]|jgi:small subunit ribosomal protein S17|uniref:Small ribosomal subunit protein uS17 n=1 Tax=Methanolacinia petrolearia (strain DSM 11571 / OCM 486 / SEBR 4847) TaxID=679926 RepID=E1RKD2_METP4|nr:MULTISPECIES: 30S ribosomal protein S17 [Methanolacinia]ADN36945.1 ribosomal protein S17P [Methanolacinia petrolearia DSM 11571]